ncbi:MAG: MBL fold metallo-hydrolase RNA specificity domain-containing protein [Methanobacteriota archaeon]
MHEAMEVLAGNGFELRAPHGTLHLDPQVLTGPSVVSHGHADHLYRRPGSRKPEAGTPYALMTAPTRDLLRLRRPGEDGEVAPFATRVAVGGFDVTLHPAGHVLGAAMVETDGVLYTGDFSPQDGLTVPAARPVRCETLIVESTYGAPRWDLPPKALVLDQIAAWVRRRREQGGPIAFGAYPLGRAQELVALLNKEGIRPYVTAGVAAHCRIYGSHGIPLDFAEWDATLVADSRKDSSFYVVENAELKRGSAFAKMIRRAGGSLAYASGWCHAWSFFKQFDIDAQFPLSDHAGFSQLLEFVKRCEPERVYTIHGKTKELAAAVTQRLGIEARALGDERALRRAE